MASTSNRMDPLAERLLEDKTFTRRYPALTQALQFVVESQKSLDNNGSIAKTEDPKNTTTKNFQTQIPVSNVLSAQSPSMNSASALSSLETITLRPNQNQLLISPQVVLCSEVCHGAYVSQQSDENGDYISQPDFDQNRVGTPLEGMKSEQTPLHFVQKLVEIQKKYEDALRQRHTLKHFHKTHKEVQVDNSQNENLMFKSRLQRIYDMNKPTASLLSATPLPPWENVETAILSRPFAMYPNAGKYLEQVLAAPEKQLISQDLVLQGVQSMPKPNPSCMFRKEICDVTSLHLGEQALSMRHRSAERQRQIQQLLYEAENKGFTMAGAHPVLQELAQLQKEFVMDQQRNGEDLVQEVSQMKSEHNMITRHVRNDFYSQLFSEIQDPDQVRYYRDKAKNISSVAVRPDVHLKTAEEGIRAVGSSHYGLGIEDIDKKTGKITPAGIKRIMDRFHYSKNPIPVKGYHNVLSRFPGVFPHPAYETKPSARLTSSMAKRKWEELGSPGFKKIREQEGKWAGEVCPNLEEFRKDGYARETLMMKKQMESRVDAEDWEMYISRHKEEMEQKRQKPPPYVIEGVELGQVEERSTERKLVVRKKTSLKDRPLTIEPLVKKEPPKLPPPPEEELKPIPLQIVVSQPTERRKTVIAKSNLAKRLPRLHCNEFVELDHWGQVDSVNILHSELKKAVAQRRLGLPSVAQALYDFSRCCQKPEVANGSSAKEFANLLTEGLPYYPVQLDLLEAGLVALVKIYEASPNQQNLAESYVGCLTTLLAVEDKIFRTQLIAALSVVVQAAEIVVNWEGPPAFMLLIYLMTEAEAFSTDLVDLLLAFLARFDDPDLTRQSLMILGVARMGHRKADQYTLFIGCLDFWRHEPSLLVYACLAVDAFAKRAEVEATRARMRSPRESPARAMSRKLLTSQEDKSGKLKMTGLLRPRIEISEKPVSWMPQDASDVTSIVRIMKMHSNHRKLLGAACSAFSSLVKVSNVHAQAVLKQAWQPLLDSVKEVQYSVAVAINVVSIIESLALIDSTQSAVSKESSVKAVALILSQHKDSAEMVLVSSSAFVAMGPILSTCIEVFDEELLRSVLHTATENAATENLASGVSCFIALLAPSRQIVNMQEVLTKAGALEYCYKALSECKNDAKACETTCRALARLVYKNTQAQSKLGSLPLTTGLTMILVKHPTDAETTKVALNALKCSIAAGAVSTTSLETGQMEVIEQAYNTAEKKGMTEVTTEIGQLLREVAKKPEGVPASSQEIYQRLMAKQRR